MKTLLIIFIILFIVIIYIYFKVKIFFKKNFGKSIHELGGIIETAREVEKDRPKNTSSLESLIIPRLNTDFPDLNINELKSMAEQSILGVLQSIEDKKIDNKYTRSKVVAWINERINDYKDSNVSFKNVKIHRTVMNKYENKNGIATIYLQTSLEYYLNNRGKSDKIQDRYQTEFIYVLDSSKVDEEDKLLGLNCPNCGAPIRNKSETKCHYCNTVGLDLVSRVWVLNKIKQI